MLNLRWDRLVERLSTETFPDGEVNVGIASTVSPVHKEGAADLGDCIQIQFRAGGERFVVELDKADLREINPDNLLESSGELEDRIAFHTLLDLEELFNSTRVPESHVLHPRLIFYPED